MGWYVQVGTAATAISLVMITLWFVQRRTKNAGIVDVAWSATIGMAGVWFAWSSDGYERRRWLVAALIAIWSLRLTVYLFRRVVGEPEEGRYATLRENWGSQADRKFFVFYQFQAAAAAFFALPVLAAAQNSVERLGGLDWLAVACWIVGVSGVTIADWQLARFRDEKQHRGETCRKGLWYYSRHPNYFFEWVHWWSYAVFAAGAGLAWLGVAVAVPLALLYFIFFVTGIPPTEAQALASRGEDYRRYQQTTSVFVPWFPKRSES